jgi:hypothetical protein
MFPNHKNHNAKVLTTVTVAAIAFNAPYLIKSYPILSKPPIAPTYGKDFTKNL